MIYFFELHDLKENIKLFVYNPPFQGKRREIRRHLLLEIVHFGVYNFVLRTKFSTEANYHFHICLRWKFW